MLAWCFSTGAVAKPQAPVILVVGDSLSAAHNLAAEQGWVALLQERLASPQHNGFQQYQVVNASVGGATTSAALQRLPSLLAEYSPAVVVLEIGGNDGLQGKPVPYITRNLETLIKLSKQHAAKVVLTGIRIPPNLGQRYTEPFFNQYAALAEKYQLALVPFLLEGVATKPELMQADRIHPTAEAQPIILDNLWPILQPLL